jgi:hypothetical protein
MKTYFSYPAFFILLLFITGCTSLLPSTKITVNAPWDDFNSVKLAYEKITPGSTTKQELQKLGFDPYSVPNIRIMAVTEIISVFLPNPTIRIHDLDQGIQNCIESKDRCTAYQISPSMLKANRIGNFWLDLFTFKRHTINSGWEFRGLITIVDNVVTYKDPPGGRPLIHTEQLDIKPLGPLQEVGGMVTTAIPKAWGW